MKNVLELDFEVFYYQLTCNIFRARSKPQKIVSNYKLLLLGPGTLSSELTWNEMSSSGNLASYFIDYLGSSFKITSSFSLKAVKCNFSAVLDDFDVVFSDWKVNSLDWIIENLWVFLIFGIFFNAKTQIFDLFLWP